MKIAAASLFLIAAMAAGEARAAPGTLDGWSGLHFGMTTAEVLKAAGPGAKAEDTFLSGPVVIWQADTEGQAAQIAAFVPGGTLQAVKIFLPDIHHETEAQCHARLESVVAELAKRYGAPDETTADDGLGDHVTAWHATFRFQNGATITADADLHDADFTCTADLIYDSHK
jgi:hypothetical protein